MNVKVEICGKYWDSGKSPWQKLTDIRDTRYMKI